MSVYIKDMDMPKNCNECPFNDLEYDVCVATSGRRAIKTPVWNGLRLSHREKWCPLVEVKTPHGRLIDINTLVSGMYDPKIGVSIVADTVIGAED